jgi:pimeloyl-ACP methyl ester carboxylesterase
VPRFRSYDGTELAYRVVGAGDPLACLPGGPGAASVYLGDLGGLSARRTLILLDNRGTGASAAPADPATYRVDRLVGDVEALREHLGLETVDLLGHSAGGSLALLYAAAHGARLRRLCLVTPSLRTLALEPVGVDEALARRAGEPWYEDAVAALRAEAGSRDELAELRLRSAPLLYSRWGDAARAHAETDVGSLSHAALEGFYAGFEPDDAGLRARLAAIAAPVLVVAGELDLYPAPADAERLAAVFPAAALAVQPGAAHFPWIDDPARFVEIVDGFLSRPA